MHSSIKSTFTTATIIEALLVITTGTAEGQADCAVKLVPCADYLNSTNPAPACCNAIKEVVSAQLPCLCNLYNNPSMLAGINMTQALELSKHSNLSADTSKCKEALSPTSSAVPMPPPARATVEKNKVNVNTSDFKKFPIKCRCPPRPIPNPPGGCHCLG